MSAESILDKPQPPPDERVAYGSDANQFIEVRRARGAGPHPAVINIHGGFWRAKYDLAHAGHLCEALRAAGATTFNLEYRRVGNPGGGWPGTFADIRSAYRFIQQEHSRFQADIGRVAIMGHSAGAQLAFCLAAHEPSVHRVISLAGVLDLKRAFDLHLSHDAVAEFLGGTPQAVPNHYNEADPTELKIPRARQWLLHGSEDDTVPPSFSRDYTALKKKSGESVSLSEIAHAGHFDLINPESAAFGEVKRVVLRAVARRRSRGEG